MLERRAGKPAGLQKSFREQGSTVPPLWALANPSPRWREVTSARIGTHN